MYRFALALALLAALSTSVRLGPAAAQGSEADVRLVAVAKYAVLGYDTGDRFLTEFDPEASREITPDDRQAYLETRRLLEQWHRFVLVDRRGDADVLIGVRAGRFLTAGVGTQGGAAPPAAGATGPARQVQVSSPHDMLTVRDRSGSVLWRQQLPGGLSGREAPLFARFRSAVETASRLP